jgi:hypothetical protein
MHIPLATIPILLLTWHPPVVTGIVHLGPRLSVNCSPLFPIAPLCPHLQNPNPFSDFPEPNVHLIKARLNPLPSIQNSNFVTHLLPVNYYKHCCDYFALVLFNSLGTDPSNSIVDSDQYFPRLQGTYNVNLKKNIQRQYYIYILFYLSRSSKVFIYLGNNSYVRDILIA